jgi:hypothetical protein
MKVVATRILAVAVTSVKRAFAAVAVSVRRAFAAAAVSVRRAVAASSKPPFTFMLVLEPMLRMRVTTLKCSSTASGADDAGGEYFRIACMVWAIILSRSYSMRSQQWWVMWPQLGTVWFPSLREEKRLPGKEGAIFWLGRAESRGIRSAIDDVADNIAGPGARYCGEVFHVGKKSGANVWVNLKSAVT